MNATNKLLDKWIAWRSSKSGGPITGAAIAIELGVRATSISNYRVGTSQAAPHIIEKMAKDIGENPAGWLALVESERARDADDRRTWARLARSFGAAASIALVALMLAMPLPASAQGLLQQSLDAGQTQDLRHYAKSSMCGTGAAVPPFLARGTRPGVRSDRPAGLPANLHLTVPQSHPEAVLHTSGPV